MKNIHSLIYLFENSGNLSFGEKKLVKKGPDIQQRIESASKENADESTEAKLQRIQALSDFLDPNRSEEIKRTGAQAGQEGLDPELDEKGETKGYKFEDKDLNISCGNFALNLNKSVGSKLEKDLRTNDLLASLDEAGITAAKIKEALGKKYDSVMLVKESNSSEISIIGYKKTNPREQTVIGSFQVESEAMSKAIEKRSELLEGFAKKRQVLQEEIATEKAAQKRLRDDGKEYAQTLQKNTALEDKYIVKFDSDKDLAWITITKKDNPNELLVRIDTKYSKSKFKYEARNALPGTGKEFNRIAGESTDKPIFPTPEDTLKMLQETVTKTKILETQPKQLPTMPAPKKKSEELEPEAKTEPDEEKHSPDATVTITENGTKKGVVKAEAKRGPDGKLTFTVKTKKGTELAYTETGKRTAAGEQIIRYADSDEYYTDNGVRVTITGDKYEDKGQKHSTVLGVSVDITRAKEKTLDDKTNAKVTLKKDAKLEKKDEKLIIDEIKTFKGNLNKFLTTVQDHVDRNIKDSKYTTIAGIAKLLEGLGTDVNKDMGKLVEKFEITSDEGVKLVWTLDGGLKNPENGDLRTKAYNLLKKHLDPQLFKTLIEQDKTVHEDERLQGLIEEDRNALLTGYITKLDKKYSVEAIFQSKDSNFAYSQEKLRDEWDLLDGTTRVETILASQFTIATEAQGLKSISQHEVPNIVARILREASGTFKKEGTAYEVDFENLFKIVKPNISVFNTDQVKFLSVLKDVTKDPSATFEKYLLDAGNLKKLLKALSQNNTVEGVQLEEKILQAVILPTIDLLESLSQLKKKDQKKEAKTESTEGLIRDMMKDVPPAEFELKEGNRFKLSEASPFQNSKTLIIGVKDGINAEFKHQLLLPTDVDNKTVLQTIFRTVGIESLIRQGCLEKNSKDEYRLVKLPQEYSGDKRKEACTMAMDLITFKGNEKKYDKKMSDAEIMRSLDLIDEQSRILKQVQKLCEAQDKRGLWDKFVGGIKGLGDFAYMSQLDGKTFFVDKSRMTREMTAEAAGNYILYNNKYYKVDVLKDVKTFDKAALTEDVNKFIALGALQKLLTPRGENDRLPSPEDIAKAQDASTPEGKLFQETVAKLQIKDLLKDSITREQINAFQIGLLVEYNSQYEKQMNMPKNKAAREFLEKAMYTGASLKDIQEAYKTLVSNANIKIDEDGHITGLGIGASIDTNGNITGVGAGTRVGLGGGFSLSVGVSYNALTKGGGAGLGLDYKFTGPNGSTFNIGVAIAVSGTGIGGAIGVANTHQLGKGLLGTAVAGIFMDTTLPIPMPGIGYVISRDYLETAKIKTAEAVKEAGFEAIEKAIESGDRAALLKAIGEHPRYKSLLGFKPFGKLTLSEDDVIAYVKMDYADLKTKGMTEASTSIFGTNWVPISRLGIGFPPSIMISIGTGVLASRPLLKQEAAILGINSALAVDGAVQWEARKEGEVEYVEDLADIYITKSGDIGHLIKGGRKEINFSHLADKPKRDEALAGINMLIEEKDGKKFLKIYDLTESASSKGIAAEVHIDPTLGGELALHTTGSDTILEGDIQNLVITRERFIFPARTGKYGSSVKDVIYISKVASALGNRNRLWANEHEETYLEKLPGYEWTTEDGVNQRLKGLSKTVFDVKGWQSLEASNPDLVKQLLEARANEKEITVDEAERKGKLTMEGRKQIEALDKAAFDALEKNKTIQAELQKALEDKILRPTEDYKKDTKLAEIRADILKNKENPKILLLTLSGSTKEIFGRELSELELNIAVQYLTRGGFIDLASRTAKALKIELDPEHPEKFLSELKVEDLDADPKKKTELVKYLNKGREILVKNAEYVARAFKAEFQAAIEKLQKRGIKLSALTSGEAVAKKMVADIVKMVVETDASMSGADLLKHPLAVLKVDPIYAGSTILYGTHKPGEKGKEVPAVMTTLGSRVTATRTIREAGFLSHTSTQYDLKSGNLEEREMSMILTETASPLQETHGDLLNSEFAVRIASLGALVFLMKSEDNYKKTMELFGLRKDPATLSEKLKQKEYQDAVADFKEVCTRLRAAQLTTGSIDIPYKDLTIKVYLGTTTRSAAWSDCGNAGFESITYGNVEILKENKVIANSRTNLKTLEPSVKKLYLELGFGISMVKAPGTPEKKPTEKPDKISTVGVKTNYGGTPLSEQTGTGGIQSGSVYTSGKGGTSSSGH